MIKTILVIIFRNLGTIPFIKKQIHHISKAYNISLIRIFFYRFRGRLILLLPNYFWVYRDVLIGLVIIILIIKYGEMDETGYEKLAELKSSGHRFRSEALRIFDILSVFFKYVSTSLWSYSTYSPFKFEDSKNKSLFNN